MSNLESLENAGVPVVIRPPTDSGSSTSFTHPRRLYAVDLLIYLIETPIPIRDYIIQK